MASNFLHDDRLGLDWAGKYPLTNQSALCAFRQVCSQDVRKTTEIWPSIIQDLNKVVLIQETTGDPRLMRISLGVVLKLQDEAGKGGFKSESAG